ncbi:MAG: M23 family metallopeptidase [Flavobacteriales bacterium]|nr:M23 family metallopeptidase [Flavobacteriales bacterium]
MPVAQASSEKDRKTAKRKLLRKLRDRYRLLLINDSTFEERFTMRLNRLNVLLLGTAAFLLYGAFVTAVIVFTPLKRYIPGYADQETKRNAYRSLVLADSLEERLHERDLYIANLRAVLKGEAPADSANLFAPLAEAPSPKDLEPGEADSLLRQRVAREEAFSVKEGGTSSERKELAGVFFFPPLRGIVTSKYERKKSHFGIDIVAKADAAVKACLPGTVTLGSWTTDAGHVLQIQHANDLVSVYKHNSVLLKKVGDKVNAGEAIAIVGNSGELTTGPHLHFELWLNGDPVDPQAYMVFE